MKPPYCSFVYNVHMDMVPL